MFAPVTVSLTTSCTTLLTCSSWPSVKVGRVDTDPGHVTIPAPHCGVVIMCGPYTPGNNGNGEERGAGGRRDMQHNAGAFGEMGRDRYACDNYDHGVGWNVVCQMSAMGPRQWNEGYSTSGTSGSTVWSPVSICMVLF